MIRPIPSSRAKPESVLKAFDGIAVETIPKDDMEYLKQVGKPLFTEDDIYPGMDYIARAFRKLCIKDHITKAYFDAKFMKYAINVLCKLPTSASNHLANAHKAISDVTMTWKEYSKLVVNVLGYDIESIDLGLRDPSGKIKTIKLEGK